MAAGSLRTLAPESNGLRVLVRLGWGIERKDYSRTYREVVAATSAELARDARSWSRGHALLRRHGQVLCRRSHPACSACPLRAMCPSSNAK
jgi:endonuclease III